MATSTEDSQQHNKSFLDMLDLPKRAHTLATSFSYNTSNSSVEIHRKKALMQICFKQRQPRDLSGDTLELVRETFYTATFLEYFVPTMQIQIDKQLRSLRVCICEVSINENKDYVMFVLFEPFGGRTPSKSIFANRSNRAFVLQKLSTTMAIPLQNLLANLHLSCNPSARLQDHSSGLVSDHIVIKSDAQQEDDYANFQQLFASINQLVGRVVFVAGKDSDDPSQIILKLNDVFTMF